LTTTSENQGSAGAQGTLVTDSVSSLASAMVRRGDRQPVIVMESGSEETALLMGVAVFRARLDSLRLRYADTTFTGGHNDRVRERFTRHMLPTVGNWLGSMPPSHR